MQMYRLNSMKFVNLDNIDWVHYEDGIPVSLIMSSGLTIELTAWEGDALARHLENPGCPPDSKTKPARTSGRKPKATTRATQGRQV